MAELHAETRALNVRIAVLGCFLLVLAIVMARLTSELLLHPLYHLELGLSALRRREFTTTVETGRVEELAQVAGRLNRILEYLADLADARAVQDHLLPAAGASGPGWTVTGRSIRASGLGGDHYAWFPQADGRLLLTLGTVIGPGIPASLLAAGIKAEVTLRIGRGEDPAAIVRAVGEEFRARAGEDLTILLALVVCAPATRSWEAAGTGVIRVAVRPPGAPGFRPVPLQSLPGPEDALWTASGPLPPGSLLLCSVAGPDLPPGLFETALKHTTRNVCEAGGAEATTLALAMATADVPDANRGAFLLLAAGPGPSATGGTP